MSSTIKPTVPWNKGAFVGPKPPLKRKQVWSIRLIQQREGRIRDRAIFDLAIDSKLRGCDLVQLRIGALVVNAAARYRATIVRQKTGKPVQLEPPSQVGFADYFGGAREARLPGHAAYPSSPPSVCDDELNHDHRYPGR